MFSRTLNDDLIKELNRQKLFEKRLKLDIRKGNVFSAVRKNEIAFYYEGGKLFTFNKEGFKTHVKYASVFKTDNDYISESKLKGVKKIDCFFDGYKRIKENCSLYAGEESAGVAQIYSKYSYASSRSATIVLDIEISLKSLDEDKKQDRIDILLFDKNKKRLIFCEAKNFLNKEIWAPKGVALKVINQIRKYEKQIKTREINILDQYKNYIDIANDMFPTLDLPYPDNIYPNVLLLIFGFDRDQISGKRFSELFKNNLPKDIVYYTIGDTAHLKMENLFKKCNL